MEKLLAKYFKLHTGKVIYITLPVCNDEKMPEKSTLIYINLVL